MARVNEVIGISEPDGLIYDSKMPLDTGTIQFAGGAGIINRGAVIAYVNGDVDAPAAKWDGSAGQVAMAIICDDVDTGDDTNAVVAEVYRTGHFCRQIVSDATGKDLTKTAEKELRDAGIYLSNAVL